MSGSDVKKITLQELARLRRIEAAARAWAAAEDAYSAAPENLAVQCRLGEDADAAVRALRDAVEPK